MQKGLHNLLVCRGVGGQAEVKPPMAGKTRVKGDSVGEHPKAFGQKGVFIGDTHCVYSLGGSIISFIGVGGTCYWPYR